MDIQKLCQLYEAIPPRGPRGSVINEERWRATARFTAAARRLGYGFSDAVHICLQRRETQVG